MKKLPARRKTPAKAFMPVYEPWSRERIAPAIGLVVKPPNDENKNNKPVLYPISGKGEIFTTNAAARET
jgi:hypothetical protein